MSASFEAILVGAEEFQRRMAAIGQFARRPRLAMQDMAAELEHQTEQNFSAQGRPKWRPLAPATEFQRIGGSKGYTKKGELRARSQRILENLKILQDSGLLASSVHSGIGDDYAWIGASRPYARAHQMGAKTGRGLKVTLPARPYLPFTTDLRLQPEAEASLLAIALHHLRDSTTG